MSYRRIFDERLAEEGDEVTPVFVSGDTYLICDLVSQKCGISLLPDYACRPMIDSGMLCKIKTEEKLHPVVWAQLMRHKDKWISNAISVVSDYLRRYKL